MRNRDDIPQAVEGLIQFRECFCMNVAETEKGELTFRCRECTFGVYNYCTVKMFINDYASEEQKERAEVMVR